MEVSKIVRQELQKKFGTRNYCLKWNHGGYSLFVKNQDGRFAMYAYDAEAYCKKEFGLESFYARCSR